VVTWPSIGAWTDIRAHSQLEGVRVNFVVTDG
jgi:hypothetical protein